MAYPAFWAALPSGFDVTLWEDPGTGVLVSIGTFSLTSDPTCPAGVDTGLYAGPDLGTSVFAAIAAGCNTASSSGTYSVNSTVSATLGVIQNVIWVDASNNHRFRLVFGAMTNGTNGGNAIGYSGATITSTTAASGLGAFMPTTVMPYYCWFPRAHQVNLDDFSPVRRQVFTTNLTGSGASFGAVQDDDTLRYWQKVRIAQALDVRITSQKSAFTNPLPWWSQAGFASSGQAYAAALDVPTGFWRQTVSGINCFVFSPDENDPDDRASLGRFVYADEAPVDMASWKGLRAPCITPAGPLGAQRNVEMCFRFLGQVS